MPHEAVERVFARAKRQKMTMVALAKSMGVDRTTLYRWRKGTTVPSVVEFAALEKLVKEHKR